MVDVLLQVTLLHIYKFIEYAIIYIKTSGLLYCHGSMAVVKQNFCNWNFCEVQLHYRYGVSSDVLIWDDRNVRNQNSIELLVEVFLKKSQQQQQKLNLISHDY